jgi:RNA polymerase sigma factor (sigma-70 family)
MPKLWVVSPQPSHEDVFVQRYERLLGQALHITDHSRSRAEDLVHDAFIQFTLSHPDLAAINDLDSYLFIVLRNMHLSQVRRASQVRFTPLSIVEYDSAAIGLRAIDAQSHMQIAEELHRICNYACIRKETSKAGSVLILRFFHGYYTTEIAQVMCAQRGAVDQWLRLARREVKAYLDDPHSLRFMTEDVESQTGQVIATTTPGDLLGELRELVFRSRRGACLPAKRLARLYRESESVPIKSELLAHIVSCPSCLEEVNKLRGLPPSSDRYTTDTLGPDRRSRGGGEHMNMTTQSGDPTNQFMKACRRRLGEVIDHRPQALSFSVNGFILGSQKVRSDLTEQILSINIGEEISFVEVFSEQGMRLMFMGVSSPATAGVEQKARLDLGEGREVQCALSFGSPWPTLHVFYHDPALKAESVSVLEDAAAEDRADDLSSLSKLEGSPKAKIENWPQHFLRTVKARFRSFVDPANWLRPATVTLVFAVMLASVVLYLRTPTPLITAADLLGRSSAAEEAIAARIDQVQHRTVNLEERSASGTLISSRRVDVWQSAQRGISARRLYDEKGSLIAGDWRRADGVQTLYSHSSRPRIKPVPEKQASVAALLNFENAWQFLPSAKDFTSLVGRAENARVEERASDYLISYSRDESGGQADGVLKVALVLSRADLHATEQMFTLRKGNEVREYRMMETSFERRPAAAAEPKVFEPEAELSSTAASSTGANKSSITPGPQPVPLPEAATRDLEVEVLRLLSETKADLGEQVSLTRTAEGKLLVQGIVETSKRKAEILHALKPVTSNPSLRVEISSVSEALGRQKPSASNATSVRQVEVPQGSTIPVDRDLREYFSSKGISNDRIDEEIRQYSNRVLSRSRQALRHAWALKRLAERFTPEDLKALSAEARAKWLRMIREHAQGFQQETEQLRLELQPIFFRSGASSGPKDEMEISNESDFIRALARLAEVASANDEAMRSAFTISAGSGAFSIIKTTQFSRSVASAEKLAARIQAQAERTPDNQH